MQEVGCLHCFNHMLVLHLVNLDRSSPPQDARSALATQQPLPNLRRHILSRRPRQRWRAPRRASSLDAPPRQLNVSSDFGTQIAFLLGLGELIMVLAQE
jgi:hypothetical protein